MIQRCRIGAFVIPLKLVTKNIFEFFTFQLYVDAPKFTMQTIEFSWPSRKYVKDIVRATPIRIPTS